MVLKKNAEDLTDRKSEKCIEKCESGKTTTEKDQGNTNEFLGTYYQKTKD